MPVPVFRPTVKRRDMGSVLSCIVSDKLGPGEISRELVTRLCHSLGHAGGATLGNSYLALSAALETLGLAEGDAVILSALSPSLWLRVLADRKLVPLVADVEPESGSVSLDEVRRLAEKGAKAVLLHHTIGLMCDVESVKALGLPVLEDASQALGGMKGEQPCGGQADLCLVSLEPENIITCGGGALVLAKGRQAASGLRKIVESSPLYSPLADMNAALGISQLAALEGFVRVRREVAGVFTQALMKSRHKPLIAKLEADHVLSSFPVALADGMKEVRQYALKKNVDTLPAFADTVAAIDGGPAAECAAARSLMLRCVLFPLYPTLGKRDVETIAKVLGTLP